MSVKIRPVSQSDHAAWIKLFDAYAEFYLTEVPLGGHERVWSWIENPDNDFWCDVAEDPSGKLVGMVQYQLMHRSLSGEMVCYLSDLYVNPDCRGCGAGRAIIDHVIEFARTRELSNVRWLTQDYNYNARRLYDRYSRKSDFILYSIPV